MAGMMITLIEVPAGDLATAASAPRPLRSGRRPVGHRHDRDVRRRSADRRLGRLLDLHRPKPRTSPTDAR